MLRRAHVTDFAVWLRKGWNAIDATSQLTLAAAMLMRLVNKHEAWNSVFVSLSATCAVFLWSKMLFFMMPFASTGASRASARLPFRA